MKLRRRTMLAAAPAAAMGAQEGGRPEMPRVLVTCAEHPLPMMLARALSQEHTIRLTGRDPVSSPFEFVRSGLDNPAAALSMMQGVRAVVHAAEPPAGSSDPQILEWMTRGTYHLLEAASKAGVAKFVFLSTLDLMTAYDPNFTVSESWRPRPTTEARVLGKFLGEAVCREFARDRRIRAITLRLGKTVKPADTAGKPFDPMWVAEEDVAHAVARAIAVTPPDNHQGAGSWWAIAHIGSESPSARFAVAGAKYTLNYQPKVKW